LPYYLISQQIEIKSTRNSPLNWVSFVKTQLKEMKMQDICDCGRPVVKQGYCSKCLKEYEVHVDNDSILDQFEAFATAPRTPKEKEYEQAITESLDQEINQPKGGHMRSTITDVAVFPYANGGNLKAFASVTLNGDFVIKGIRIVNGRHGLFLGFPENRKGNQNYAIAFPISAVLRHEITKEVVSTYEEAIKCEEIESVV
jgi:stage V sporulation protein G